jgi:hypothetical protein
MWTRNNAVYWTGTTLVLLGSICGVGPPAIGDYQGNFLFALSISSVVVGAVLTQLAYYERRHAMWIWSVRNCHLLMFCGGLICGAWAFQHWGWWGLALVVVASFPVSMVVRRLISGRGNMSATNRTAGW